MKKHVLLTLSVALASPLLMAQSNTTDSTKQKATPATPAIPATPATPSSDSVGVEGPTTTDEGQTSGAARAGGNSVGATGNPNNKSAKTRTRSSNGSDFGSLDANSDGKISQDELKVNTQLGARFGEADANKDGILNRAEFAKLQSTGRDKDGKDVAKQPVTEGSDRTDKDDELNRKLPGQ